MKEKGKGKKIPYDEGRYSEKEGKAWGNGEYANMPQEVVMEEVGPMHHEMDDGLDDTMGRLEQDAEQAGKGFRKNLSRGMY